mmetsp:Transcript_33006/g.87599  ORF Transcript_33006/g.87599 Transcript_33006/m.87599 type:complete len:1171 (-) Transcript_33006:382-3894(-)
MLSCNYKGMQFYTVAQSCNTIGEEGCSALAGAFSRLTLLQKLYLDDNSIGYTGCIALAGALAQLMNLQTLKLDMDPWYAFGMMYYFSPEASIPRLPEEIIRKGWIRVIEYLGLLTGSETAVVSDVRIFLMGDSLHGKTSLMKALVDTTHKTKEIPVDNRTIALEARLWKKEEFTVYFWDLAGQEAYRAAHSFFVSESRGIHLLVYSPRSYPYQDAILPTAGEVATHIFNHHLKQWLNLIHFVSPGAHIAVISTHSETPPNGVVSEHWLEHVQNVADEMKGKIELAVAELDELLVDECTMLTSKKDELKKHAESLLCESSNSRLSAPLEAQLDQNQKARTAIDQRLMAVMDQHNMPKGISLLFDDVVICVDSVKGNGETVKKLSEQLESTIPNLSFMGQAVPKKWILVRDHCQFKLKQLSQDKPPILMSPLSELQLDTGRFSKQDVKMALEFWDSLGFVKYYNEMLVLDIFWLVELAKPLLHHNLQGALQSIRDKGSGSEHRQIFVSEKIKQLSPDSFQRLMVQARELECYLILNFELFDTFDLWKKLNSEEREKTLSFLEACHLVASFPNHVSHPAAKDWLVVGRATRMSSNDTLKTLRFQSPTVAFSTKSRFPTGLPLPPGLFSTFQAKEIRNRLKNNPEAKLKLTPHMIQLTWKAENGVAVSRSHLSNDSAVVHWASCKNTLKTVVDNWEETCLTRFPGLSLSCSVFTVHNGELCKWDPDQEGIGLTQAFNPVCLASAGVKVHNLQSNSQIQIKDKELFYKDTWYGQEMKVAQVKSLFPDLVKLRACGTELDDLRKIFMRSMFYYFAAPVATAELKDADWVCDSTILHCSGHSKPEAVTDIASFCLRSITENRSGPELVFLNICSAYEDAVKFIKVGVPYVICWKTSCLDRAAACFAKLFYESLVESEGYGASFEKACCGLLEAGFSIRELERTSIHDERVAGVPCLLWKDNREVDRPWTLKMGKLRGEWVSDLTDPKGWQLRMDSNDWRGFSEPNLEARAGRQEKRCVNALGLPIRFDNTGEFSAANGGLDDCGQLTAKALKVLEISKYEDLWGVDGKVVCAAKQCQHDQVQHAIEELKSAIQDWEASNDGRSLKLLKDKNGRAIAGQSSQQFTEMLERRNQTLQGLENIGKDSSESEEPDEQLDADAVGEILGWVKEEEAKGGGQP